MNTTTSIIATSNFLSEFLHFHCLVVVCWRSSHLVVKKKKYKNGMNQSSKCMPLTDCEALIFEQERGQVSLGHSLLLNTTAFSIIGFIRLLTHTGWLVINLFTCFLHKGVVKIWTSCHSFLERLIDFKKFSWYFNRTDMI